MKKRSFLSILLVFVMIAAACLFVGCDEEETNAKIDNAVVEAVNQATDKIDAAKAALETAIAAKADTATLTAAIEELNAAIDAAKKATTDADTALKTELTAAIEAAKKAAVDASATNLETAKTELAAAVAGKADAATVDTKVTELNAAIEAAKTAAAETVATNINALKTELTAAIAGKADATTVDAKAAELATAIDTAKKIAADADVALKAELTTAMNEALNAVKDAYVAIEGWDIATEKVIALLTALDEKYAKYSDEVKTATTAVYFATQIRLYRAVDDAAAQAAYDFAVKTFDAYAKVLAFEFTEEYYYAAEVTAINNRQTAALAAVLAAEYGDDIDAIIAEFNKDYEDFETKAEKIEAGLTANGSTAAEVVLTPEWKVALDEAAEKLVAEEALDEESGVPAVKELYEELVARYDELTEAKTVADELNAKIEALTTTLSGNLTVISYDYVERNDEIVNGVKTWKETYFADYEQTGANWDMLGHDAYAALEVLYEEKIGVLVTLAQEAEAAINALFPVTIRSEKAINDAIDKYDALNKNLKDLKVTLEGIVSGDLAGKLINANSQFTALCREAISAYDALDVVTGAINTTNVTIYNGAAVDALVTWYDTYLGVDVTDENSDLGLDTLTIKMDDGSKSLTITADDLAAAKALYTAYETLEEAKITETKAVSDAIDALKVAISNKEAADAALVLWTAWSTGANAPEGFTAEQYAIVDGDATYVVENYDALLTIIDDIATLIVRYDAICDEFAGLNKDVDALVDADVRAEYVTYVEALKAAMAALNADDADETDLFTAEQYAAIAAAEDAIAKGAAIQAVKEDIYAEILATLEGVADGRVVGDLTARANTALNVAIVAIKAGEDPAIVDDELDLILFTAEQYKVFVAENPEEVDDLYSALVILNNRVKDGHVADLEVEKNMVVYHFTEAIR